MTIRGGWMILPMALLVTGCGGIGGKKGGPKTPVSGQRTSILSGAEVVSADDSISTIPVTVPEPVDNADWEQSGGNASKAFGHAALGAGTQEVWRANIQGGTSRMRLASPPVVQAGKLYAIGTDATVSAFDAKTGQRLWASSIKSKDDNGKVEFGGGVSVEGDRVYATSGIGDVAALNVADGKVMWKVRPGGPLRGSPSLSNGNVYVMSQDNQLFALNETDGATLWTDGGTLEPTGVFGVAAPSAGQGSVLAGYSSGELTAYRYENGRVLWGDALSKTSISTSVSTLTDIDADPVIDRGRVFAIGEGGRMASYELLSGQRLWELNIGGVATPLVVGDWVFVVTDKARLFCITRATGKVRWISELPAWKKPKKKTGAIRWHGPILAGGKLVLVSTEGALVFADPATGKTLSEREVGQGVSLPPIVADKMLYLLTDEGRIIAYR
ncbi:PQQ-like beta-propeller repeat protein [Sphingobium nicotianae]|nr:PQQ-binding-like beta-propeller repeat protein [Sphingobium nicotianae]